LLQINPYTSGLDIVSVVYFRKSLTSQLDCGDVPVNPFDQVTAIKQINAAYRSMLSHPVASESAMASLNMQRGLDGQYHPRIISLGGDHTIVGVAP
jgi:agmatinase